MTFEKIRKQMEEYAADNNMVLSEHADKIIARTIARDGNCPCRVEEVKCPCPQCKEEVEANGQCHCTLFLKQE